MTASNKIFEGMITDFHDRNVDVASFGFIDYESSGRQDRAYFRYEDVEPDNLGRRAVARVVGNLVRFRLEKYNRRGSPSLKAVEIVPIFSTDVEDPEAHREISQVCDLVRGRNSSVGSIFLRRECGDQLFLSKENVAPDHRDRFRDLQIGHHVWHAVKPPDTSEGSWMASEAEFYSVEEEQAMTEEISNERH